VRTPLHAMPGILIPRTTRADRSEISDAGDNAVSGLESTSATPTLPKARSEAIRLLKDNSDQSWNCVPQAGCITSCWKNDTDALPYHKPRVFQPYYATR